MIRAPERGATSKIYPGFLQNPPGEAFRDRSDNFFLAKISAFFWPKMMSSSINERTDVLVQFGVKKNDNNI